MCYNVHAVSVLDVKREKMTRIISCVNLKGGVGKTALAVNFACYSAAQGHRTLLIDLDPQTNASIWAMGVEGWKKHAKKYGTVANLLGAREHASAEGKVVTAEDVIAKSVLDGIDLIPSHLDLFTVDLDLAGATNRERRLEKSIKNIIGEYDLIVCDCPPNLTIPTQNALAASTHYVVPVSPDFLSAIGIALLTTRIEEFAEEMDHGIEQAGIVLSRVGRPAKVRSETIESIRGQFGADVLDGEIKERVVVAEAAGNTQSIFQTKDAAAKEEFSSISEQLLDKLGL